MYCLSHFLNLNSDSCKTVKCTTYCNVFLFLYAVIAETFMCTYQIYYFCSTTILITGTEFLILCGLMVIDFFTVICYFYWGLRAGV